MIIKLNKDVYIRGTVHIFQLFKYVNTDFKKRTYILSLHTIDCDCQVLISIYLCIAC